MIRPIRRRRTVRRAGFTIFETTVAAALLLMAIVLLAQIGVRSVTANAESRSRQVAQELAANILESARATDWPELSPKWAAAQHLPEFYEDREWRLTVKVERVAGQPHLKQVRAEVQPRSVSGAAGSPAILVGWFASRLADPKGGRP